MSKIIDEILMREADKIIDKLSEIFPIGFVAGGFALDRWRGIVPKDIDFYIPKLDYDKNERITKNIYKKIDNVFNYTTFLWKENLENGDYGNERIYSVKDLLIGNWEVQIIQWITHYCKDILTPSLFRSHVLDHFPVSTTCIGLDKGTYLNNERFLNSIAKQEISVNPKFFGKSKFDSNLDHIQKQQAKFPGFKLVWE